MGQMIDILGQVRRLTQRLAPTPVCEQCLVERIEDAPVDMVHMSLSELAVERGFGRENDVCGLCGEQRLVIKRK